MRQVKSPLVRGILVTCGSIAVALGVIGIFLPLLPTTPFLILAAYCFSRSSERFHTWLITHPRLGPLVSDWQRYGVIRPRIKIMAVSLLSITMIVSISVKSLSYWAFGTMVLIWMGVTAFIVSRPSRPKRNPPSDVGTPLLS